MYNWQKILHFKEKILKWAIFYNKKIKTLKIQHKTLQIYKNRCLAKNFLVIEFNNLEYHIIGLGHIHFFNPALKVKY